MRERKFTLREKILMYLDVWLLWILSAIADFLSFLEHLVLSFLPFMWKVDTVQFKRPVPILHRLAGKMHALSIDWWYKAQERRCKRC